MTTPDSTRTVDSGLAACPTLDALRQVWLFAECTTEELVEIAAAATVIQLAAGAVVVREGAPAPVGYAVMRGRGVVERSGRMVGTVQDSALVGAGAFFAEAAHNTTVTTTAETTVARVSRDTVRALLARGAGRSIRQRLEEIGTSRLDVRGERERDALLAPLG